MLLVAIAYPFAGRSALAIPLTPATASRPIPALPEGAQILGPSAVRGLTVVRVTNETAALSAFDEGWLFVAVPSTLCGAGVSGQSDFSRTPNNG